ncbi:MAG: tRNA (N6-isopentenyl adenosine(37)-C2)-methylthiotransferase MiaB [Syntrophaceae bacterium]|nr:tRNA (N6-isopentenyl adenosine(37)-C2)-methylthiotransferase MiaB [Syntrophaceae bacterium]
METATQRKTFFIRTFGCQMNVHDAGRMADLLREAGWEDAAGERDARLILINTCSIREKAAQKVYSLLGRLQEMKRCRPDLILGVAGCLAQQLGGQLVRKIPAVDLVFGTHQAHRLPEFIRTVEGGGRVVETAFTESVCSLHRIVLPPAGTISAFVTIMQGCDNYCAFCVVPYLRGREESRPCREILEEIRLLAGRGVREVVLLGQNVNSYGRNLAEGADFPDLLQAVSGVEGIERIRFTTSHPKDLSDKLIRAFREIGPLCGHIHLPVQSGSDRILARMNRGYTRDDYLGKVARLRDACPEVAISSDMIAGFPGETEEDFEDTLALMEEVRFDSLFSFKYSEREGTAALLLDGKLDERVKGRRLRILQDLQDRHTLEKHRRDVGRTLEVLVEGTSRNSDADLTGRTRTNRIVNFPGDGAWIGRTVRVAIREAFLHSLRGEAILPGLRSPALPANPKAA